MTAAACEPSSEDLTTSTIGSASGTPSLLDTDGDGINDADEGQGDTDGDGIPDFEDDDTDGDGIPDVVEAGDDNPATAPRDADGDGIPDFKDTDSDNNGILDKIEGTGDADGDGIADYTDLDDDNDNVTDGVEILGLGSDCDNDGVIDAAGTPESPRDCDADGNPDYRDPDSDGDTIGDINEGTLDTDGDGIVDRYDGDSDNDTIPDAVEAGDADISTPPLDSDGDGAPNYLDPDSDDDGLSDTIETQNGTSTTNADSDNDGVNDLIETAAGTDPLNPADNPQANGDFVFVVPYQEPTTPPEDTLKFRTNIQYADVYFAFDTTGSMVAELNAMRAATGVPAIVDALTCDGSLSACAIDADCAANGEVCFQNQCITDPNAGAGCIPDMFTGVGKFDILNTYQNLVSLQGDPQVTANAIPGTGGGSAEAPFQPSHCIADPALCPNDPVLNCTAGGIGCPAFRQDAVRIYIQITDADNQCSGGGCANFTAASAGAALQAADIKFISLYGTDDADGAGTPASVANDIAIASGTLDTNGNPFTYLAVDGNVVNNAVTAVLALARGNPLNTTIESADDPADLVDATQFIDYLVVNISGMNDCTFVNPVADTNADTHDDAFPALLPGTKVCWDVHPVPVNTTVPATDEPQLYKAILTVRGDGSPLDSRDVYFLIPPKKVTINPPS